jgi:O-antigen/teichoic acid export membrane protein
LVEPRVGPLLLRYKTIIGQGIWVVSGQVATGALTLAGTRLITQFVSPQLYGLINLVQNSLVLLRTLFCSASVNAGLRYYPDAERGGYVVALRRMLVRTLGRALIAMEVLVIIGGLIWSLKAGIRWWVVLILAIYVAVDVFLTLEMSLFNAGRRQRPAAIFSVVSTLARPVFVVAGVLLFGSTVEVVFAAMTVGILVTLALLYASAEPRGSDHGAALPRAVDAAMWRYAIPLIPIALLNWTTAVSDRYIIEWVSHDVSGVGIYAAGYGLISQPFLLIHGIVALTLRPVYFAAVSRGDAVHAERTFRIWLATTAAVCTLATLIIYLGRVVLVETFLGPKYRGAAAFVPWIALGYLFYAGEQVLEQSLLAHKRTASVLVAQACGAFASVAITIPCVMHFGAVGAAYACPIYFLIQLLVVAGLARARTAGAVIEAESP